MTAQLQVSESAKNVSLYSRKTTLFKPSFSSAFSRCVEIAVFFYLATLAIVPDVYGYVPALLLLAALITLRVSEIARSMDRKDWLFISGFLGYSAVFLLLISLHQDGLSSFDRPSRFVAASIILTMLLRVRISATAVFTGAALGAVCSGLFAIYKVFSFGVARVSSFDNAIYFGNGALILALVSLAGLFAEFQRDARRGWLLLLYAIGTGGGLLGLLLSVTRGGWLALPVIALVGLWCYRGLLFRRPMLLASALVVVAILGTAAANTKIVSDRVGVAMSEAQEYFTEERVGTSVGLRLEMWKAGALMFSSHPLVGVGEKEFYAELQALVESGQIDRGLLTFRHLHNQFVDHAAKGGLLAILALLLVFGIPGVLFWRYLSSTDPIIKSCAFAGVAFTLSFVVFCLTQGMFSRNLGVMMFVVLPVFLWAIIRQVEGKAADGQPSDFVAVRRLD